MLQDLRYAVRGLVHAPGFAITVILTLGLGIGANAAMFAVIDRLMFRPFPHMRDPSSMHRVYVETTVTQRNTYSVIPYTRYLDLTGSARSFSHHAAVSEWRLAVGIGRGTLVRKVAGVSASFFDFFDMPGAGTLLRAARIDANGLPGRRARHDYWRTAFGGRGVLEQLRWIAGNPGVGVAPAGSSARFRPPGIFVPISHSGQPRPVQPQHAYDVQLGLAGHRRRKPGVSQAAASANLTASTWNRRVRRDQPRVLAIPYSSARDCGRASAPPGPGLESTSCSGYRGRAIGTVFLPTSPASTARVLKRQRGSPFASRLA
jgi:hypothetical protein